MHALLQFLFPATNLREQREQILRTYESLRRQIPLLYAVALVNLIGVHVATNGNELRWLSPITILTVILLWRMAYWLGFQKPSSDIQLIRRELLKMAIFTAILSCGFSVWIQFLITAHPTETMTILFYAVLTAFGAAYGLASFPRAAVMPLFVLGVPVAVRLFAMENASSRGIGVSLVLVLLIVLWLLSEHGKAQSRLIAGKITIGKERNRALAAERVALKRANEDPLTGLANRGRLVNEIEVSMVRGPIGGGGSLLAICDLDGFKSANDTHGHAAGDAILREFADRLTLAFGDQALVARLGGDEFAVFWRYGLSSDELRPTIGRICELAGAPIAWEGKYLSVGASCGLTEAGPYTRSETDFIRQADSALYKAKTAKRGSWHLYDKAQLEADKRRHKIEDLILSGDAAAQIEMHFQPIIPLVIEEPVFAEALARWNNDELGNVGPDEFIRVAEALGEIDRLNEILLDRAVAIAKSWPAYLALSFNLSAVQLSHSTASDRIIEIVKRHGMAPKRIQFEVTETAILADLAVAKEQLNKLSRHGFVIALDDFGVGYASVGYLRSLSFDTIKLDGSYIKEIPTCERARSMLLGLVNLCHATGAQCVAEHVETEEQLMLAKLMGFDYVQGRYCGFPETSEQMLMSIERQRNLSGLKIDCDMKVA